MRETRTRLLAPLSVALARQRRVRRQRDRSIWRRLQTSKRATHGKRTRLEGGGGGELHFAGGAPIRRSVGEGRRQLGAEATSPQPSERRASRTRVLARGGIFLEREREKLLLLQRAN